MCRSCGLTRCCMKMATPCLRQPCTVPRSLVDDLPWDLRERLCKTYARTIADLQAAIKVRQNAEAGDDARPRSTKYYTTTYTSSQ